MLARWCGRLAALGGQLAGLNPAPLAALGGSRAYAVVKGPQQTDAPNPKQPFVQEDSKGVRQHVKESNEDMLKQSSGVAEDVRMKDQAPTSLRKMGVDQRGPENETYVKRAREMSVSSEREMEDQEVADAVFDDTKSASDVLSNTTSSQGMMKRSGTATAPGE